MGKFKSLISDTLIFAIGNFTVKIIYFVLMPIYTLALTTEDFGIADLLNNSLQLILPVLTLSISDAVFRFILDKDKDKSALLTNGIFILLISHIVIIVTYTFLQVFFQIDFYWLLFVIWYILDSIRLLFAQYARAEGRIWAFSINGIIGALILLFATFFLVYKIRLALNGYLLSFICADLVSILYLLFTVDICSKIRRSSFNRLLLFSMLTYCLPLIPNMLSWWLTNISSRYIVAGFCGLSVAGLFSSASKLPALLNIVTSIFQQSWQLASIKEYQESPKSTFFNEVFRKYSLLCLLAYCILVLLVPYISKIVLQGEFYSAWIYTPMLMFSALLGCYSTFFGTFYSVIKDNVKTMKSTLYGAVTNIIICLILIPIIGITGALIANSISYFIIVLVRIKDVQKYIYLPINYLSFLLNFVACLGQAIGYMINMKIGVTLSILSLIVVLCTYRLDILYIINAIKNQISK